MTKLPTNSVFSKSKALVTLEYVLLALCLCVIALRTTFTESPTAQSTALPANLNDSVYSLTISAVLILSFVVWFVWSFCSRRFLYRFTAIEVGLAIFAIAAIAAGLAAANKRAAITNFVIMLAPILMAVLLVQILDSHSKIKLTLICIAALGMVSAYESANQLFVTNQAMIDEYKKAPQTLLEPLGITAGTSDHFQFEHRLYSKDVKGFFTTGNSAGSFAIFAAFAGIALFLEKFRNRKSDASGSRPLVTCGIAVAVIIFGLAITKSKGAIIASLIAAAMFIIYLLFGNWLKTYKRTILIVCLLLGLAGCYIVVSYGLADGQPPGGSSMLVRWQYWHASARMYADHPFRGVGPGNFAHFYTHYKPAEALESVADPHNFPLSILTQYGPLGLIGFLALVSIPLWRAVSRKSALLSPKPHQREPAFTKLAIPFVIVISAALLLIRPMIMPVTDGNTLDVMIYVILTLYVAPVAVFIIGFWLLTAPLYAARNPQRATRNPQPATRNAQPATRNTNIIAAALFCACLGVILHNLIDFAIFEPGVFTTFWAIIACLIALDFHQKSRTQVVLKPAPFVKAIGVVVSLVLIWAYFNYALIPVAKAAAKTELALRELEHAHQLLDQAAEDDRLDPAALNLNGRLYLQHYKETGRNQPLLLKQAEECFLAAIERNRADFKNFKRLAEVYNLLAETSIQQEKTAWLNKAFESASDAVERYPGSARLRIELAKIAEQLGKTDVAIKHYEEAIDIEDKYRLQFQEMYPGQEIFSRLGEEKYQNTKQRIKHLSEQPTP